MPLVRLDAILAKAPAEKQVASAAQHLATIHLDSGAACLALRIDSSVTPQTVDDLVCDLLRLNVPVVLVAPFELPKLKNIPLSHVLGLIIESALILPNGHRRDYFSAVPLRKIISTCTKERESRPDFFVGFMDLWDERPTAAVVKRAEKLAKHFGAVFTHRPREPMQLGDMNPPVPAVTINGFEHLRRWEITETHKSWCLDDNKPVSVRSTDAHVARLPLAGLKELIPEIDELLRPEPLNPTLAAVACEKPPRILPPNYVDLAPKRTNIWTMSSGMEELSTQGCYPLTSSPSREHYAAVVEEQVHLKTLRLLQPVKGDSIHRIIQQVGALIDRGCRRKHLLEGLVEGLSQSKIGIFKGLDSGFGTPSGDGYFWGVSHVRKGSSAECIDIFVSLKAPSDTPTVLHTWLAHHGVPRLERYIIELDLERVCENDPSIEMPSSLAVSLERATNAELLFFLEQLRVTQFEHEFRKPMIALCRHLLIDEAESDNWRGLHSLNTLAGTIDLRELFDTRLRYYARKGAVEVPNVDNLLRLYSQVDILLNDALFYGDRRVLAIIDEALRSVYKLQGTPENTIPADINADMFALLFFIVLRRAALEDIYLEATDRCPYFLSQTDQAAVFAELWVLGSQCEIYFGILPRDLGEIVYRTYHKYLEVNVPPAKPTESKERVITMYWPVTAEREPESKGKLPSGSYAAPISEENKLRHWKKRLQEFGALSIFCFPAILDVILLSFLGRGLFTTAFMEPSHIVASGYAVLISLLLAAGVTGWVGSVGHYYMPHYAYDNLLFFHVQRLSGGFMLSFTVAAIGLIAFAVSYDIYVGLVFAAYLIVVSTYLTLLGIMATMHQRGSPLRSGRLILWRTIPFLFLSPLISSFVNGHDLKIYLPISYAFLVLVLIQYRSLCTEWSGWMSNIPELTERDIADWYSARYSKGDQGSDSDSLISRQSNSEHAAETEFRKTIEMHMRSKFRLGDRRMDPVAARIAKAMPYINWLMIKEYPNGDIPPAFSAEWFNNLGEAKAKQKQLCRGLKEHNAVLLFRASRYDIGQNVALFLIALMDRWTALVMSGRDPQISLYTDFRSRYGLCLCIIYFCFSVMSLDATLQNYWPDRFKLSEEKMVDFNHTKHILENWEKRRFKVYCTALVELAKKLLFILGFTTLLLWLMVDNHETIIVYWCYIFGYTCVVLFQFNRCFAIFVRAHVTTLYFSALFGLIVGCILHALPWTYTLLYIDILAMCTAAFTAFLVTSIWVWIGFRPQMSPNIEALSPNAQDGGIWKQPLITALNRRAGGPTALASWKSLESSRTTLTPSSAATTVITQTLQQVSDYPSETTPSWQMDIVQRARDMWANHNIVVSFVDREAFANSGLRGCCSASRLDSRGRLDINVGVFGASEIRLSSWASVQGRIATEAILYHVARSWRNIPHKDAVLIEHLLLEEGETMSRRISFEIAMLDPASSRNLHLKTNAELMRHLCLDLDVDAKWGVIPAPAREAILCRILGETVPMAPEFIEWLEDQKVDMGACDFNMRLCLSISHESQLTLGTLAYLSDDAPRITNHIEPDLMCVPMNEGRAYQNWVTRAGSWIRRFCLGTVRWIAVVCGADSNIERELWYKLRHTYLRTVIITVVLAIWNLCHIARNSWVFAILIYHRPAIANIARLARKGAARAINGNSIVVELSRSAITGFASENDEGMMVLNIFDGILTEPPANKEPTCQALYDSKFRLQRRVKKEAKGTATSTYRYHEPNSDHRWPTQKVETSESRTMTGYYDKHGRICVGTLRLGRTEFSFRYYYKATPKGSSDILRADYEIIGSDTHDGIYAYWGEPTRASSKEYNWVPSERLCRIVRKVDGKTYITTLEYQHRRDPTSVTVIEGDTGTTAIAEPPKVCNEEAQLLQRPKDHVFHSDDLLIYHGMFQLNRMRKAAKSAGPANNTPFLSSLKLTSLFSWHGRIVYRRAPTWRVRTELWSHWLKTGNLDAITACWMDEDILRQEPLLREYWKLRDRGRLTEARAALDRNINQIFAAIEIETAVSEVCLLPIKTSDLYAMGLGNDATQVTTRPEDCYRDTKDRISVIFTDIGCWPEAPGGVSNCRRDLVNGHSTIRNHVLAESANEYGIPRFQIEKNVQSLKLLPLWGLDGRSAHHGIIDNYLQSQVDEKIENTDDKYDIEQTFVPLLKAFVKGARSTRCSREELINYSNVILSISKYFEYKDYNRTWESPEVERAWVEAWMTHYDEENVNNVSDFFEIERPSLSDLREALGIYKAYFFVFAVKIPDDCPRVFQSTHHGIGSLFGMILKYRKGSTFCIWDHAILWRECCLNISPAQCALPIPVQSVLLAGIGLATRLAYMHADVIMPCTSLYNP